MKQNKILLTVLVVLTVLSLTIVGCSAFVSTSWEYVDMLVPTSIRLGSSVRETLVTLPNNYHSESWQEATVTSPTTTSVDIFSDSDSTEIFYGGYADTIIIEYSSFYDITVGDFVARRAVTFDFDNQDFEDVVISQNIVMSVIYAYYDTNGILREDEYLSTFAPSDDNTVTIDFRTLVENYGSGNKYIKSVEIFVTLDDANCDLVTFTSRESGEYGIANGARVPTAISGTIDDFDLVGWLIDSVNEFFAMPIFGTGLTIGGLVAIFVAFPVVIWFLKLVAGG